VLTNFLYFIFGIFAKELKSHVFYFWNFMFREKNEDKKSTLQFSRLKMMWGKYIV